MKTVTTIGLDIAKCWRVDGPDQLAVISGDGETAAEVMLGLDSEGRIDGAFAPDRPRSATAPILPTPWRGRSPTIAITTALGFHSPRSRMGDKRQGRSLLAGLHRDVRDALNQWRKRASP